MSGTTENTVKAVAESFIQNAKAREFTIRVQNMLINDGKAVEDDVLKKASLVLRPIDYDAVVEDRISRKRCGFPKCDNHLPEINPNTKYIFSVKDAVMVDVSEGYVFCSQKCAAKSAAFKVKLSEEPLMMRNFVKFRRTPEVNDEKQPDPEVKTSDTSHDMHFASRGHGRTQNPENAIRASMGLPLIPDPQEGAKESEDISRGSEPPVVVMSSTVHPERPRRASKSVAFAENLEQPATPSPAEGGAKAPASILVKSNKSEQSPSAALDAKGPGSTDPSERSAAETKQSNSKDTFTVSNLFVVERKRPPRPHKTSSAEVAPSVTLSPSDQPTTQSIQNGEADSNASSATSEPSPQATAPPPAQKQKLPMHIVRAKAREAAAAAAAAAVAEKKVSDSTAIIRRDAAAHLDLVLSRTEEAEKLRDRMKVSNAATPSSPVVTEITEEMKKTMTPAQLNTLKFKQSLAEYEKRTKEQLAEEEAIAQRIAQRQEEARKARAEMARKASEILGGVEAANATHSAQVTESGPVQPSQTPADEKVPSDSDHHPESGSESEEESENPNETDLIDDEGDDDPDTTRAIEQAASFERMERTAQRAARRLAQKNQVGQEALTADAESQQPSQQQSQTQDQGDDDDMSDLAQAIMGMLSGEAQLLSYLTSCVTDSTYRALSRKAKTLAYEVETTTTDPEAVDFVPASEFELGQSLTLEAAEQRRSRLQSLRALIQPYFSLACTGLHTRISTASLSRRLLNLLQTLRLPQAIPHVTGSYWKSLAVACLLAFAYQDGMNVPSRCSALTASKCTWLDHPSTEVWNTFLSQHSMEYDSIYSYYVILTTGVDDDG